MLNELLRFKAKYEMKKLTLPLLLGLGLMSQTHDLTAQNSKPLDYKYLVLSEKVIEDMNAFEALQKGWSSWRNDNNIKMADQTVWTDSQGYGFTASTYKSFSEIEKNVEAILTQFLEDLCR